MGLLVGGWGRKLIAPPHLQVVPLWVAGTLFWANPRPHWESRECLPVQVPLMGVDTEPWDPLQTLVRGLDLRRLK